MKDSYGKPLTLLSQVELFTRGPSILLTHNDGAQQRFNRILASKGVKVHLNSPVEKAESVVEAGEGGYHKYLTTADGKEHGFDECLWCTNATPQKWLADTGLQLDPAGFILVDDCLQSLSTPNVFAGNLMCPLVLCI